MVPPWYSGPAPRMGNHNFGSSKGSQELADIIRKAWAKCGVLAPVRVVRQSTNERAERFAVRMDMPGGLPPR